MSTASSIDPKAALSPGHTIARPIAICMLGVAAFIALDGILFRTALYREILEPGSSTGLFELILRREQSAQNNNGDNLVVALGDSRFAFSPRLANEIASRTGLIFRHAGVAGSGIRAWYYMLRDLDPTANRYRAIIIGIPNYNDEDQYFNPADDIRELHFVIERLRWSDILDFARSFESPALRWQAFRGGLLKGIVLQKDIAAFLSHPEDRIANVTAARRGFDEWTFNFEETTRSMTGIQIDWATRRVIFPPDADQNQRDTIGAELQGNPPQTGRLARFRRKWFGRIIDRYQGSHTKIIFIRLPRGPVPRPDHLAPKTSSSLREFTARPNVLIAHEHAFDALERPEYFKDGVHLNRAGIALFSQRLAEEIGRMVAR